MKKKKFLTFFLKNFEMEGKFLSGLNVFCRVWRKIWGFGPPEKMTKSFLSKPYFWKLFCPPEILPKPGFFFQSRKKKNRRRKFFLIFIMRKNKKVRYCSTVYAEYPCQAYNSISSISLKLLQQKPLFRG